MFPHQYHNTPGAVPAIAPDQPASEFILADAIRQLRDARFAEVRRNIVLACGELPA